ncbi:hypothetical protein PSAC2689_230010 [Paraburkholderia sacchari]
MQGACDASHGTSRKSRCARLTACGDRPPAGAARAFIVPKKTAFVSVSYEPGRAPAAKRYNSPFAAVHRPDRPVLAPFLSIPVRYPFDPPPFSGRHPGIPAPFTS